jgi:hypothetical protein
MPSVKFAVGEKCRRSKWLSVKNFVGKNGCRSKIPSVKMAVGQNCLRLKWPSVKATSVKRPGTVEIDSFIEQH